MATRCNRHNLTPVLSAARHWVSSCLIGDASLFGGVPTSLWTRQNIEDALHAFADHPIDGPELFLAKLQRQLSAASDPVRHLMAEVLWALLLFPSNLLSGTKREQVQTIRQLAPASILGSSMLLADEALSGIGSAGPAYQTYRPDELEYLLRLTHALKTLQPDARRAIFADYDRLAAWIETVPRNGDRQFRHMLRYFAFPDRVERISSNNDRRKILRAFQPVLAAQVDAAGDVWLDDQLLQLRCVLEAEMPGTVLDFYESPLRERWQPERKVNTEHGTVAVVVPTAEDLAEAPVADTDRQPELRRSLQVQAQIARIGIAMHYRVWIPASDRQRVASLLSTGEQDALLTTLPLNYDDNTLDTIREIDVIWLQGRAIIRAFEVEDTTSIYSGLLRMADLLALQPNISIRLHIVADVERREKVFREIQRPVFMLLSAGPLSGSCTYLSYDSVRAIAELQHLAYMRHDVLTTYEEAAITPQG